MNHFDYVEGLLHAEAVSLDAIAAALGTPFYCYASATLERHYRVLEAAFEGQRATICYSLKANSNLAVIRSLANLGAGADIVSQGELRRALAAGVPAEKIIFSGVGKTREEMALALEAGIHQFNVESEPELEALNEVALARQTRAPVALRINPDIDARTHEKIATGRKENKFGIPWGRAPELFARARAMTGIEPVGVDVHIGSQLTEIGPFERAFERLAGLVRALRAEGHAISRVDLGGGLGIPYEAEDPPAPEHYAQIVRRTITPLDCEIILEPGRVIVGNAGVLVCRVIYVKPAESRTFVILDGAMNDLLRPSLYGAYHRIVPVRQPAGGAPLEPVDVVGPICETGDSFAQNRPMPPLAAGDLVAVMSAGAYGAVMASSYNSRPLVPEVLVKGAAFSVIRPRPDYDDMLAMDVMPDWLNAPA
jgi:diaminopimelate decarboxylase